VALVGFFPTEKIILSILKNKKLKIKIDSIELSKP
jgi:hypothetical protein